MDVCDANAQLARATGDLHRQWLGSSGAHIAEDYTGTLSGACDGPNAKDGSVNVKAVNADDEGGGWWICRPRVHGWQEPAAAAHHNEAGLRAGQQRRQDHSGAESITHCDRRGDPHCTTQRVDEATVVGSGTVSFRRVVLVSCLTLHGKHDALQRHRHIATTVAAVCSGRIAVAVAPQL